MRANTRYVLYIPSDWRTMQAYAIQGFYFQERQTFGIRMIPIKGAVVVVHEGITRNMFSGVIWQDASTGTWAGEMEDQVGQASLEVVWLTETELRFVKRYAQRNDDIGYVFRLDKDGVWVGSYEGPLVGEGKAVCLLTPIPEHMLRTMEAFS